MALVMLSRIGIKRGLVWRDSCFPNGRDQSALCSDLAKTYQQKWTIYRTLQFSTLLGTCSKKTTQVNKF